MKVKQVPDDFVVDEQSSIRATNEGRFSVYRLKKSGIGTLETLRAISRVWKIPRRALGFGGLKDRHAVTTQWLTIINGPHRNLDQKAFRLTYEGLCGDPHVAHGPRRQPVPHPPARPRAGRGRPRDRRASSRSATPGLPSYFDEQRFGSLRGGGGFAALHLLKGDPEAALRAVIASPSREDRAHVRERKRRIRAHWGEFDGLPEVLEGTPMREPVLHFVLTQGRLARGVLRRSIARSAGSSRARTRRPSGTARSRRSSGRGSRRPTSWSSRARRARSCSPASPRPSPPSPPPSSRSPPRRQGPTIPSCRRRSRLRSRSTG